MPLSKKKTTTFASGASTQEIPSPVLPEQEAFRQYLRHLAVSAVQVLIEQVMREELEQCIHHRWHPGKPLIAPQGPLAKTHWTREGLVSCPRGLSHVVA